MKQRRSRGALDRSLRAHAIVSRIDRSDALADAARKAILKAGFPLPSVERVLGALVLGAQGQALHHQSRAQNPRRAEERASLRQLIKRAEAFDQARGFLAPGTWIRIRDADKDAPLKLPMVDPLELGNALASLLKRAELALRRIPQDEGGRRNADTFKTLAFCCAVAWRRFLPNARGVVRHGGQADSAKVYSGPLVEFAAKVLQLEGRRAPSRYALGKFLYECRARAAAQADQWPQSDANDEASSPLAESVTK